MINDKITLETSGHALMIGLKISDKPNTFDPDMYRQLALAYGEQKWNPVIQSEDFQKDQNSFLDRRKAEFKGK